MFYKYLFCLLCIFFVLCHLHADEDKTSSKESSLKQTVSKSPNNAYSSFSKEQLQRELEKEKEENRKLLKENFQIKKTVETIIKCLSDTLQIHLSQNPSEQEINAEIRIRLSNHEPIPKTLSKDDLEYTKEMLSDDPSIVKTIEQYHAFISQLKGKRIIIIEENE